MESCSQNHFKIFFKLLIFFFRVWLTLQNCTVPPWACTNTAQSPSLLAFAFGVYHRRGKQSKTRNQVGAFRAVFSSCSVCIMYVCIYYFCCREGQMAHHGLGGGWGKSKGEEVL